MTINFGLGQAVTGLMVNQSQISVVSNNIANVNTPGYSRKEIQQTSLVLDGIGQGVAGSEITRRVDQLLRADINRNTSTLGATTVQEQYLSRMTALFGTPEKGSELAKFYTDFTSKLDSLALRPEDASNQTAVVNAAISLTNEIKFLESEIQNARRNAIYEIDAAVTQINNDLNTIRSINAQITRAGALGQSTADLKDQRDAAVKDLAQYMDISTYERAAGDIVVFTPAGKTLIDGQNAYGSLGNMALKSPGVPSSVNAGTTYVNGRGYGTANGTTGGGINGIILGGMDSTGTVNTGIDITLDFRSGKLAQLIELRDRTLPAMTQQLDTMSDMLRAVFTDDRSAVAAAGNSNTVAAATNTMTLYDAGAAGAPVAQVVTVSPPPTSTGVVANRLNTAGGDANTFFTMGTPPSSNYGRAASLSVNASLDVSQGGSANLLYLNPEPTGAPGETLSQTLARRANASVNLTFTSGNITSGSYTLAQFSATITSTTATLTKAAIDRNSTQESLVLNLETRASEVEGVNVDEEMAKLIQFQNAYAASARVIQIADEMMNTLLGIGAN